MSEYLNKMIKFFKNSLKGDNILLLDLFESFWNDYKNYYSGIYVVKIFDLQKEKVYKYNLIFKNTIEEALEEAFKQQEQIKLENNFNFISYDIYKLTNNNIANNFTEKIFYKSPEDFINNYCTKIPEVITGDIEDGFIF